MRKMSSLVNSLWVLPVACFVLVAAFSGCKKSTSAEVTASDGKAKLELSTRDIFAEGKQELSFTGKSFPAGTVPANSILAGQKKTIHPAIEVAGDGLLPNTKITIPEALAPGEQELQVAGLQFAKALKVGLVQLEYMMWGTPDELDTVNKYLKDFETKFPNIKVKILHVPQMYDDKLKTMFAAKTPPDVMYMGLENFPSMAVRGVFMDLQPFVDRDNKEFKKEDFYPNLVEIFRHNKKLYGIPKDFTPLALYYNKDLFDKAGVKYPNENWTWNDFLAAARRLTKDINNDGKMEYGFVMESWFGQWIPWLWQNGGEVMDKTNTQWLLGDPKYIEKNAEAIQFFSDLVWKEKVAPTPSITGDLGSKDMFMTGRVAMCTYGRWMCMDFKNIKDFQWDVEVMPKNTKRASTLFVVCYSIAAQTKHPEASWQLIKFLTGTEGQIAVAQSGHAIPSRKSVADTKDFLEAKVIPQKINARAFLKQIEYARPVPTNPHWVEVQERLGREMELVFLNKGLTAKKAIENIQKDIEEIIKRPIEESEVAKK